MSVIAIVNPKGGVGKSTLATNLAGYFAASGESTALGDIDPQHSSHVWLGIRAAELSPIAPWAPDAMRPERPARGVAHAVLDTPAGLDAATLHHIAAMADRIIVPLQPSIFDIYATQAFLALLAKERTVKRRQIRIGVVGMRVDARTRAAEQLQRFVEGLDVPVLATLRDTQNYIQLAAHGLSLWDVAPSRVEKDLEQWRALTQWVSATD
ncbi:ParA family protein [Robbsia sp. Bb-Pol-6]|uniref:ParA family protein n=1 Tax=Robbsia betulipollinis TaxID=2981849 RepID=A0ABT3ZLM9_9BURK|nr:ParA family protein [Robbsia betulipollinis]MCY0387444.1 ParA family protein [Robbsia betulipollinis]